MRCAIILSFALAVVLFCSVVYADKDKTPSYVMPGGCISLKRPEIKALDNLNAYVLSRAKKDAADDGCSVKKVQIKWACAQVTDSDGVHYPFYAQVLENCGKKTVVTYESGIFNPTEQLFSNVCDNARNGPMPGGWSLMSSSDIGNSTVLMDNAVSTANSLAAQKNCVVQGTPNIVIACSQVVAGMNYQYGAISTFNCPNDNSYWAPFNNTFFVPLPNSNNGR